MGDRDMMLELIRQAYAARGEGHLENLMAAFHPQATFALAGDKTALPIVGRVEGHGSVRATMDQFIASFRFVGREILSELVEGDRAAVHSRIVVQYNPTGKPYTTEVLDLFRFQDGKIIELIEFADTALIGTMMAGATT
jgi:ketosteroid isomerase-like protein